MLTAIIPRKTLVEYDIGHGRKLGWVEGDERSDLGCVSGYVIRSYMLNTFFLCSVSQVRPAKIEAKITDMCNI